MGLSGELPQCLSNVSKLEVLSLHKNNFFGPMPYGFGSLANLRILTLHNNMISGALPHDLVHSPKMSIFTVHSNQITGLIPSLRLQSESPDNPAFKTPTGSTCSNLKNFMAMMRGARREHVRCSLDKRHGHLSNVLMAGVGINNKESLLALQSACATTCDTADKSPLHIPVVLLHGNRLSC